MAKSIFKELESVKYEIIGGTKFDIRVSPFYTYDKYNKKVSCKLTFEWDKSSNDNLIFDVIITKTNRKLGEGKIQLDNSLKRSLEISLSEADLNGNSMEIKLKLGIERKVEVTKTKTNYYSTGILWWKEYKSYNSEYKERENQVVANKVIILRQTLKNQVTDLRIK